MSVSLNDLGTRVERLERRADALKGRLMAYQLATRFLIEARRIEGGDEADLFRKGLADVVRRALPADPERPEFNKAVTAAIRELEGAIHPSPPETPG